MDTVNNLLEDIIRFIDVEGYRLRGRVNLLSTVLASVIPILVRESGINDSAIIITDFLIRNIDPKRLESLRSIIPYDYVVTIVNSLTFLSALTEALIPQPDKIKIQKYCLDSKIEALKWLLALGKVSRLMISIITDTLKYIINDLEPNETRKYVDILLAFKRIGIPDDKKYDYEIAVIANDILEVLSNVITKSNVKKYREEASNILKIATEAWKRYGFNAKAKYLQEKYSIIIQSGKV